MHPCSAPSPRNEATKLSRFASFKPAATACILVLNSTARVPPEKAAGVTSEISTRQVSLHFGMHGGEDPLSVVLELFRHLLSSDVAARVAVSISVWFSDRRRVQHRSASRSRRRLRLEFHLRCRPWRRLMSAGILPLSRTGDPDWRCSPSWSVSRVTAEHVVMDRRVTSIWRSRRRYGRSRRGGMAFGSVSRILSIGGTVQGLKRRCFMAFTDDRATRAARESLRSVIVGKLGRHPAQFFLINHAGKAFQHAFGLITGRPRFESVWRFVRPGAAIGGVRPINQYWSGWSPRRRCQVPPNCRRADNHHRRSSPLQPPRRWFVRTLCLAPARI